MIQRRKSTRRVDPINGAEVIGEIYPGMRQWGITNGKVSLIEIILYVCREVAPASLDVATWALHGTDSEMISREMEIGNITEARILCDASIIRRENKQIQTAMAVLGGDRIRLLRTHAKFFVARGRLDMVCVCSMNLNKNVRVESYCLADDKVGADFYTDFMDGVWSAQGALRALDRASRYEAMSHSLDYGVSECVIPTKMQKMF